MRDPHDHDAVPDGLLLERIQPTSGRGDRILLLASRIPLRVGRAEENRALKPVKPVFCSESFYDHTHNSERVYHARWQAWVALLNGCAGYGYGAHGMWQFYDPNDPLGETGKSDARV